MSATITVDDEYVDAYKCIDAYSKIINVKEKPTIKVGYFYESGYGSYDLYVYIRNIITGKVSTEIYEQDGYDDLEDEDDNSYTIDLTEYGSEDLEIYICLKGDCYSNLGPFFKSEPLQWYKHTTKYENIRNDPYSYLKSKDFDVFDFITAFTQIKDGEFTFKRPEIHKTQLFGQDIEKINQTFVDWKKKKYHPTANSTPIVKFTYEFIKYWNQLKV